MPEPVHNCLGCGEEYFRRVLQCPQCGKVGVQFLYKYCRFDVNALSGLVTRSLWCPKVASLNDPFEFAFSIEPNHLDGVPIDPDSMAQAKEDMKQYGVLCFSEIGDDILMWSHYSGAHTGFCLQFERQEANDLGSYDRCVPVIYDGIYPKYSLPELTDPKNVVRIMTLKSPRWSYEQEWRMLVHPGQRSHPYPGTLVGITFGARMPKEDRTVIATVLGEGLSYREAVISETSFDVNIVPYAPEFLGGIYIKEQANQRPPADG
jgi:hypothetical protein